MDEISQMELRIIALEKSIADLQKQADILKSGIATLQGQIGSLNSRLDGYKRNADDRLKVLENPPSLNSGSGVTAYPIKEKFSFWSKFW